MQKYTHQSSKNTRTRDDRKRRREAQGEKFLASMPVPALSVQAR